MSTCEQIFSTAKAAGGTDSFIMTVNTTGQIRILVNREPDAELHNSGDTAVYSLDRSSQGIRVTGRLGLDRCVMESTLPAVVARYLLGSAQSRAAE